MACFRPLDEFVEVLSRAPRTLLDRLADPPTKDLCLGREIRLPNLCSTSATEYASGGTKITTWAWNVPALP